MEQASCSATQSHPNRSRRWWWIGGAAAVIGIALFAGWGWLAATGVATILVAAVPCLAMCALGLCMRGKSTGGTSLTDVRKTYETPSGEPPSRG
ncbi:MAG: hypothetical protein ACREQZ_07120 [Woeseiaceae bacterium]